MKNILSKEELTELLAPIGEAAEAPKLRAMIICPHQSAIARVSGVLQGLGFDVDPIGSSSAALEQLGRSSYQMILSDLDIWQGRGERLFERLEPAGASPVIFFILRPEEVGEAGRLLDLGVTEVIRYPVDADALDRILERALELSGRGSRSPIADLHEKYKGLHRAYDELWRQVDALREQNELHRSLLAIRKRLTDPHHSVGEVIGTGMDLLQRFVGADAYGAALLDKEAGTLETHLRALRPDLHQEAGSLFFRKISRIFPSSMDPMKTFEIQGLNAGNLIKSSKVIAMRRMGEQQGAVAVFFAEKRLFDRKTSKLLRNLGREIMVAAGRVEPSASKTFFEDRPGIFPFPIFEQILEQEIFRLERHEGRFGLLRIEEGRGGRAAMANWARLAPAVGSILRRGDCLAVRNSGGLFIFLDEVPLDGVCRVAGRLYRALEKATGLESPAIGGTLYIPSSLRSRNEVMVSLARALEIARKDSHGGIIIHKGEKPGYRRVRVKP